MKLIRKLALSGALLLAGMVVSHGQTSVVYDNGTGYTGDLVDLGPNGQFTVGDEIFLSNYGDVPANPTPGAFNSTVNRARLLIATEGFELTDSATVTLAFSGPALDAADPLAETGFESLGSFNSNLTLNNAGSPVGVSEVWFNLGSLVLPPRVQFDVTVSGIPAAGRALLPVYGVPEVGNSFTDYTFNSSFRVLPSGNDANFGLTLWTDASGAPVFTLNPVGASLAVGGGHTMEVAANGEGVSYQWFQDGSSLPGRTAPSLVISNASVADAGSYTVTATDASGTTTSSAALVNVAEDINPPVITSPVSNQSVTALVGSDVTFSVVAGPADVTYSWTLLDNIGQPVGPELGTASSLTLSNLALAQTGSYQVTVTNDDGTATRVFSLTVADGLSLVNSTDPNQPGGLGGGFEGDPYVIEFTAVGFIGSINDLQVDWSAQFFGIQGGYDPDIFATKVSDGANAALRLTFDRLLLSENATFTVTVNDGVSPEVSASHTLDITPLAPTIVATVDQNAVSVQADPDASLSVPSVGTNGSSFVRKADGDEVLVPLTTFFAWEFDNVVNATTSSGFNASSAQASISKIDAFAEGSATARLFADRGDGVNFGSASLGSTYALVSPAEVPAPTVSIASSFTSGGAQPIVGDDITLTASPAGASYVWRVNGAVNDQLTGRTVTIPSIQQSASNGIAGDNDVITVLVTVPGNPNTGSASFTIDINYGIEIVDQPSASLGGANTVVLSEDANGVVIDPTQITASASGATGFSWRKDGSPVAGGVLGDLAQTALDLTQVGTTVEQLVGAYTVVFSNSEQEVTSETVTLVAPAAPPAITTFTPQSNVVDLNQVASQNINFVAQFTGDLPMTAELLFDDGVTTTTLATQTIDTGSAASFPVVIDSLAQSGTYTILLENTEATARLSGTVTVQQAPVIGDAPVSVVQSLDAGASSSLTAGNITGSTPITVVWTELTDGINSTVKTETLTTSGGSSSFTPPLLISAQTRNYQVVAANGDGESATLFASVDYQMVPEPNVSRLLANGSRPVANNGIVLLRENGDTVTFEATNALFNGEDRGTPVYTWTRPDSSTSSGSQLTVVPSGSFTGSYTLLAENDLGSASVTFEIQGFSVVEAPQVVSAGDDISFGIQLTGNATPTFEWTKSGQSLNESGNLFSITGADPFTSNALYQVTMENGGIEIAVEQFDISVETQKLGFFIDDFDGTFPAFRETTVSGFETTADSTVQGAEPGAAGLTRSIWAQWVSPGNGELSLDLPNANFLSQVQIFDTSLQELAYNDATNTSKSATVTSGASYLIRIASTDGRSGDVQFDLDYADGAAMIGQIQGTSYIDKTLTLNIDIVIILQENSNSAAFSEDFTIDVEGGNDVSVEWDASFADDVSAVIAPASPNGNTYSANLSGVAVSGSQRTGTVTATITETINGQTRTTERTFNVTVDGRIDEIEERFVVIRQTISTSFFPPEVSTLLSTGFGVSRSLVALQDGGIERAERSQTFVDTTNAGKTVGEPNHGGIVGGNSTWIPYTPTITGTSTITTDGSEYDTLLAVYRPTSAVLNFDTIEEVAFDNNSGSDGEDSALSFDAVAGETYYIVIDGVGGAQGLAVLNIDTIAPLDVEIVADTDTDLIPGSPLKLSANVTATEGVTFQWFRGGVAIEGATSDSYEVASVGIADAGSYTVEIVEQDVSVVSDPVEVTILGPEIVLQPESVRILEGETGLLDTLALSASPVVYQWFLNNEAIVGATSSRLSVFEPGVYAASARNDTGAVMTESVTVLVTTPPNFTKTPTARLVDNPGEEVTLSVEVEGDVLGFQWLLDGETIDGATAASYIIPSFSIDDQGLYSVIVFGDGELQLESRRVPVVYADAPFIILQPRTQVVNEGDFVLFQLDFESATTASVVWKKDGEIVSLGTEARIYGVADVSFDAEGVYTAEVTNDRGTSVTRGAVLDVLTSPTILTSSGGGNVVAGDSVTFSVEVIGESPIEFEWLQNGFPIAAATSSSLTIPAVSLADAGEYQVVARNGFGSASSVPATLTVVGPLEFLTQPFDRVVPVGSAVTFEASVVEIGNVGYQWFNEGEAIPGATSPLLTFASTTTDDTGFYTLAATNEAGTVTSSSALLSVGLPPEIVVQPVSVSVIEGEDAQFSVEATGLAPLSYQWFFDGFAISDSNFPALVVSDTVEASEGSYSVVVTNALGSATSSEATLTLAEVDEIAVVASTLNEDGTVTLTFEFSSPVNTLGILETSLDFETWTPIGAIRADSNGQITRTFQAGFTNVFFRVRIVR